MNKFSRSFLTAAAGLCIAHGAFAADSADAQAANYPRMLTAAEIQKLYDENVTIDAVLPKGRQHIEVHGESLSGQAPDAFNTQASTSSTGTWKVDAADNRVCHSWQSKFWRDACFHVRQTGPDSYEYVPSANGPGFKFTVSR